MRTSLLALLLLAALSAVAWRGDAPAGPTLAALTGVVVHAQGQPAPQPPARVDVQIQHQGGRAWYVSPVWVAIGAIALVVLILLVVVASRGGGGTTVVR